jgi:hypothetical protein
MIYTVAGLAHFQTPRPPHLYFDDPQHTSSYIIAVLEELGVIAIQNARR